jgi:hypothetical protein
VHRAQLRAGEAAQRALELTVAYTQPSGHVARIAAAVIDG